jgi:hypothetical protein
MKRKEENPEYKTVWMDVRTSEGHLTRIQKRVAV